METKVSFATPKFANAETNLETTAIETPLGRLIRQRGLKKGFVDEYVGIWPSRLSQILKGSSYMTLAEGLKAAELFGVEVRELLP